MRTMMARAITATIVAVLAVATAAGANATENRGQDNIVGGTPSVGTHVTYGGTTQSLDPTKYNYVEPALPEGTIVPMDASGFGTTSPFNYSWGGINWSIPTGRIYHEVKGSGLTVTNELANWIALSPTSAQICNWRWNLQNRYGTTIHSTVVGSLQTGCKIGSVPTFEYVPDRTMKTGLLCARLFVNGSYRGEQCHNVFP